MNRSAYVGLFSWALAILVVVMAVIAWGQGFAWQFDAWSTYLLFPLLGLMAFSLMWSHYVAGAIRRLAGLDKSSIQSQLKITGYAVLALILLHPGLLIWQRWRDGYGLPPGSYMSFVAKGMSWLVLLGTVSLGVFLAYELKPWFKDRSWWPWVAHAGDLAMVAIFYHGLRLGSQTQTGWYYRVWLFYGLTLVLSLAVIYYKDSKKGNSA